MPRCHYFTILTLLFFLIGGPPAFAQGHNGYCDSALSTSDSLDCVKNHKNDVQDRLNEVYKKLDESQTEELKPVLAESQQAWITYRDAQCKWERERTDNASLKRIYELSCVTLLTNMRKDMLSLNLEQEQETTPREFGANPRWRNALVDENPETFWRIGDTVSSDLDCDGQQEKIVAGLEFLNEDSVSSPYVVIAISENPATGRPESKLLKFSVGTEKEEKTLSLCSTDISLSTASKQNKKNGKTDSAQQSKPQENSCNNSLDIIQRNCPTIKILWDKDQYKAIKSGKAGG